MWERYAPATCPITISAICVCQMVSTSTRNGLTFQRAVPKRFHPQAQTVPSDLSARLCSLPPATWPVLPPTI